MVDQRPEGPNNNNDQHDTLISKLDFGDPLYLHPSDTTALTIVGVKLKGTENYIVWKSAMELALKGRNKLEFVLGTIKKHETDRVLIHQWERCNAVVLNWIINSISEDLSLGHVFSEFAHEVWVELKETYHKVDGSIIFSLHQKINTTTQNGASLSDYYHKLNSLWKQFDSIVSLPACSCAAGPENSQFTQRMKLLQFLMGLDEVYVPLRSNILSKDPLPSAKGAFAIISAEESHRNINNGKSITTAAAYVAKFDNKNKGATKGPIPKCSHCNKMGHSMDNCYEIIGYPPNFKNKQGTKRISSNSSSTNPKDSNGYQFSSEQVAKLMALISDKTGSTTETVSSNMAGLSEQEKDDW